MSNFVYLDNAATTRIKSDAFDAMLPYLKDNFSNSSAIYSFAQDGKKAIDHSRREVANLIGASPDEIYFTSGGSEADNWALIATLEAYSFKGKHIITTKIEHHAILNTAAYLEKKGYDVTYLDVDEEIGLSRLKDRSFKDRLDQESIDFHHRVKQGYKEVLRRFEDRIEIVDASKPLQDVIDASYKLVLGLINGNR